MLEEGVMFGYQLIKFYMTQRAQGTDERRIAVVQKVLRSAVADAEAEATGLRKHIARTRTSVAMLLAQIEDGDPNATCRTELKHLEQRLRVRERRLERLKKTCHVSSNARKSCNGF
jgi:hypothetical protein